MSFQPITLDPGANHIDKESYVSAAFLEQEKRRMWPKVWHPACREEEIPNVGDYLTYDITGQSFIVVQSAPGTFKAFYNSCPHRGRRVTEDCGNARGFTCQYHGWKWHLDGGVREVIDRQDWGGCLADEDARLSEIRLDRWGGWIFINEDPDAESLHSYLAPVQDFLDPFELERMRYKWSVTIEVACNWKVAIEAFNEGYHVQTTHRYILPCFDDVTQSFAYGKHAMFGYWDPNPVVGRPASRLGKAPPEDPRPLIVEFVRQMARDVTAIYSERDLEAARRLLTEVPATAPREVMLGKVYEFQREAAIAAGAGWPDISMEQLIRAGADWHIFPNLVILPFADSALWYRARPHPTEPGRCFFDLNGLQRYAPGAEPPLTRLHFTDWQDFKALPPFLIDDFKNMPEVQKGMNNRGFRHANVNPVQEVAIANFHRVINAYLAT